MPHVSSSFISSNGSVTLASCCAFLSNSSVKNKSALITDLKVSIELYKWWVDFLISIGLGIRFGEKEITRTKTLLKWEENDELFSNGRYAYPKGTKLKVLTVPSASTLRVTDGKKIAELYLGELYVIRDGVKLRATQLKEKVTETKVHTIATYTCYKHTPQNLLVHTALRYGWHPDCKVVIEKCKELTDFNLKLSPYQILALAHGYLKTSDFDILMHNHMLGLVSQAEFLKRLRSSKYGVTTCFSDYRSHSIASRKKLKDLLAEEKFEEYVELLEKQ